MYQALRFVISDFWYLIYWFKYVIIWKVGIIAGFFNQIKNFYFYMKFLFHIILVFLRSGLFYISYQSRSSDSYHIKQRFAFLCSAFSVSQWPAFTDGHKNIRYIRRQLSSRILTVFPFHLRHLRFITMRSTADTLCEILNFPKTNISQKKCFVYIFSKKIL